MGSYAAIRKYFYDSGKVDEISDTVTEHTAKLDLISADVGVLKVMSDEIKHRLAEAAGDITTLKLDMATARLSLDAVREDLERLGRDLGMMHAEVGKISADMQEFREETQAWQTQLSSQLGALSSKVANLDDKLDSAMSRMDDGISRIESEMIANQEKLDSLMRAVTVISLRLGVGAPATGLGVGTGMSDSRRSSGVYDPVDMPRARVVQTL